MPNKLPFWKWFNEKYPCSTNHTDYKLAIKACTMQQSLKFDEMCLALDFYSDTSHLPHTSLISKMYGKIALNMILSSLGIALVAISVFLMKKYNDTILTFMYK